MRKNLLFFLLFFSLTFMSLKLNAQIFSPYYSGQNTYGIIYYPYGYYQGQIYNGYANGMGYFVMMDGSIYYGMYSQGWCNGPGVFISRYYGYVTGCWNMGNFVGQCYGGNPYSKEEVEEVIDEVAENQPSSDDEGDEVPQVEPHNYKVKEVDPNTPLGGQILGGMRKHP